MTEVKTASEQDIQSFWNANPCGEWMIGGRGKEEEANQFFDRFDALRYRTIPHIPDCLDNIDFQDKRTLEIGLGLGADAEQIVRRGAKYNGLDLTEASVQRVKERMRVRELPYETIKQGSALAIPHPDNHFDIVFSYGVLHHIPDIHAAAKEIFRVLKPGGQLIIMVYPKHSLNYWLSISILRRLGLVALYYLKPDVGGMYGKHVENAKKMGLFRYLRMKNFIHRNTDGPENPYSKVYTRSSLREDFASFTLGKTYKRFMHAPPVPVKGLPGGRIMGWSLWAHFSPNK